MSLMDRVKIAYDLGCRMAVADMEKVSKVYIGNPATDVAATQVGLTLGEIGGHELGKLYGGNSDLAKALPYLTSAGLGYLGNLASKNLIEADTKDTSRQGDLSLASQIGAHLASKGTGFRAHDYGMSGPLAGYLGQLASHVTGLDSGTKDGKRPEGKSKKKPK